jgi:hypothetical protein
MMKLNLSPRMKLNAAPVLVAGAIASAIVSAPFAAADLPAHLTPQTAGGMATVQIHPLDDPGGGGCVNGQCGSGGANGGPGGGPGGSGCVPTADGVACGSGGVNAGPGGIPGGSGCLPGVGCGSGHG